METYDGPPQSDCTSRIYRPFGRESVILWTQMRRCLRAGHLSRVSRERKGTDPIRSSLCVPMMPSLQRGPAKSILTPSQIDGPSSRVCLGHAALTYVPTPHDPIHISFLFFPSPSSPSLSSHYLLNVTFEKNVNILR